MDKSVLTAIVAVVAVALLGLLLRRGSLTPSGPAAADMPRSPDPIEPDDMMDEDASDETVAVTSDGWSFVPIGDRDRVQLVPPAVPDELSGMTGKPGIEGLGRGDLIAARVARGAPDHDPWRLEALGRDHEYRSWRFETEEAARSAASLVADRVVRAPRDQDGEPMPIGDAEFAAARRQDEEIEAELAMPQDIELDETERGPIR